jgi:hypothetical protein
MKGEQLFIVHLPEAARALSRFLPAEANNNPPIPTTPMKILTFPTDIGIFVDTGLHSNNRDTGWFFHHTHRKATRVFI